MGQDTPKQAKVKQNLEQLAANLEAKVKADPNMGQDTMSAVLDFADQAGQELTKTFDEMYAAMEQILPKLEAEGQRLLRTKENPEAGKEMLKTASQMRQQLQAGGAREKVQAMGQQHAQDVATARGLNAPAESMEDFIEALNAIVDPVLEDDEEDFDDSGLDTTGMDLGDVGSELDQDDDGEGKGFLTMPMYDQLGKILDSQDNPKPVNTVKTDDGKVIKVAPQQAKALRLLATTDNVKPQVKTKFLRDIQTSQGLMDFVDIKDYHEIAQLFVKRYL
jgi:hypothetical protein